MLGNNIKLVNCQASNIAIARGESLRPGEVCAITALPLYLIVHWMLSFWGMIFCFHLAASVYTVPDLNLCVWLVRHKDRPIWHNGTVWTQASLLSTPPWDLFVKVLGTSFSSSCPSGSGYLGPIHAPLRWPFTPPRYPVFYTRGFYFIHVDSIHWTDGASFLVRVYSDCILWYLMRWKLSFSHGWDVHIFIIPMLHTLSFPSLWQ